MGYVLISEFEFCIDIFQCVSLCNFSKTVIVICCLVHVPVFNVVVLKIITFFLFFEVVCCVYTHSEFWPFKYVLQMFFLCFHNTCFMLYVVFIYVIIWYYRCVLILEKYSIFPFIVICFR